MKSLAKVAVSLLMGCALAACQQSYIPVSLNPATQKCVQGCELQRQHCKKVCQDNCSNCQKMAWAEAKDDYNLYKKQTAIAGVLRTRQLTSYRDPLQCRKVTCSCAADAMACLQACTGRVYKELHAASTCP